MNTRPKIERKRKEKASSQENRRSDYLDRFAVHTVDLLIEVRRQLPNRLQLRLVTALEAIWVVGRAVVFATSN
jgi:hypothetical protein